MIRFLCPCSAQHEQESPIPPMCWLCKTRVMVPYAPPEPRQIGEIVEPIVDEIMTKARANA